MIYVGIDVAKDKHDFIILGKDGEILEDVKTVANNMDGLMNMWKTIKAHESNLERIKIGLEATGHYCYNLLGFLTDRKANVFVFNPVHITQFKKVMTLRKTKTDKVDSKFIARMLMSDIDAKPYSTRLYHNEELKSLTRYRAELVHDRSKLKVSIRRLINILFPELESLFTDIHTPTVYKLLLEFPGCSEIGDANLTRLANLLYTASRGRYGKEEARKLKLTAQHSIGQHSLSKAFELQNTLQMIENYNASISEVEKKVEDLMNEIDSPITTIPGVSIISAATILAEIGDVSSFDSPDKILAFAGMSPSIYQSGKFLSSHAKMEKRGSTYLRKALFMTTQFVCSNEPQFSAYLTKKRLEGKHYYVAISHATKRLVRLMYAMLKSNEPYRPLTMQENIER